MIESPSTTTILDPKPPAYSEDPDAPLDKDPLLVDDIPVVMIKSVPITSQATYKFLAHLKSVGGFFARWRGFGQYIIYNIALNAVGHGLGAVFGIFTSPHVGDAIGLVISIVITCRLHTLWTHAMIATPSATSWYKRIVPRKQAKVLLLPSLVFALAEQLVVIVPVGVALALRLNTLPQSNMDDVKHISNAEIASIILRVAAVPASAIFVVFTVLLPAKATLVRIEACLLPEDQETIVSFDRETIMGEIDVTARGSAKKMFAAAWRSFSRAARLRVVKVYLKALLYQFVVLFCGLTLAATVFWLGARDDIKKFFNEQQ